MTEWLEDFYGRIQQPRKILLLLNNCSAHILALKTSPPLENIRVCWLPPNSTSRFQPLDQEIIAAYKAQFAKPWLQYMVDSYHKGEDPMKTMNLRLAIR